MQPQNLQFQRLEQRVGERTEEPSTKVGERQNLQNGEWAHHTSPPGHSAFKSSTVSARNRFGLAAGDFLSVAERMKSPRLASCCRTPRRTATKPSLSLVCTHPRNAASRVCCCTAWIGAFHSLQSRATWPGLSQRKHFLCDLSIFG